MDSAWWKRLKEVYNYWQDTVIALQALSNMATVLYSPTSAPVTVTVGWTSGGRRHRANVTIDDSTRILLQQVEIPITVRIKYGNIGMVDCQCLRL